MNFAHLLVLTLILLVCTSSNEGRKAKYIEFIPKKSGLQKANFHQKGADNGQMLITNLDHLRDLWMLARHMLMKKTAKFWQYLYRYNLEQGKIQIPKKLEEFPCNINGSRSSEPPSNINELRPGDIDIVAAVGDSFSAGNAAMSRTPLGKYVEYRGMTFSGGGMADWRTLLTLPNILKVFNPNLYGFSTANVVAMDKESYLNVAEPMLLSRDLVYQVQMLIQRMKNDQRIDMHNHWKLLTIFVGTNDICTNMCHHDNLLDFLKRHEDDLRNALVLLRDNVPRLIVNLLSPPNVVSLLQHTRNPPLVCKISYTFSCSCLFGKMYDEEYLHAAGEFLTRWQAVDEHISSLPEFQTKDFAVRYQPFMANMTMPTTPNGDIDLRYFGGDCFHFSQLGHASVANALWNNMLQAPGQQESKFMAPFEKFECPTDERPYIATLTNSVK